MIATPVSKEEVRMLVASIGYQDTAKRTGISPNTLYQWARRFQWNTPIPHAQKTVRTVRNPADALADELAENERETRLSLSRYARKAAQDSESATLRDAPYVHKAAQVAGIAHSWGENKGGVSFSLNVLNVNTFDVTVEGE